MAGVGWRTERDLPPVGDPGDVLTVVDGEWTTAAAPAVPVTSVAGEVGDISAADLRAALGTPKGGSLATAPGAGDDDADGYAVGSVVLAIDSGLAYICTDASTGAAVWGLLLKYGQRWRLYATGGTVYAQKQLSTAADSSAWVNVGAPVASTLGSATVTGTDLELAAGAALAPSASPYRGWAFSDLGLDLDSGRWAVQLLLIGEATPVTWGLHFAGVFDATFGTAPSSGAGIRFNGTSSTTIGATSSGGWANSTAVAGLSNVCLSAHISAGSLSGTATYLPARAIAIGDSTGTGSGWCFGVGLSRFGGTTADTVTYSVDGYLYVDPLPSA